MTEIFKESAVLSWQPPVEDGGTPVTGYHIERCMANSARWMKVNKDPVPDLSLKVIAVLPLISILVMSGD